MRVLRLLSLLFACSLAPIVFAQSADLSVTLTMPSTATAVTVQQQPPPTPTLKLTLTAAPDVVHPGDLLTYTAQIANTSSYVAPSVVLTLVLPGTLVATSCGTAFSESCFFPAISPFATQTVTRTIRVDAGVGATLFASATVSASNVVFDPKTDGATLSMTVAETPEADVAVTVDAAPVRMQTGDVVTFTITARNDGTSAAASDVTVNFFLPSALAFLSASPGCAGTSGIICTAGTLDSRSSAVFAVTARAVAEGIITTTASVSTTSPEPNRGNNSGSVFIIVNPPPQSPARRRAARH